MGCLRHPTILAGNLREARSALPCAPGVLHPAPPCRRAQRGHNVKVLNTLRFAIDLTADEPDLHYRGRQLSDYDAILPRIGNSITYFGTAVVRQFEQMDVYTPNTANGISSARDKLRANQILSRHNIAMPPTAFVRNRADVRPAIERVGGAPSSSSSWRARRGSA